MYFDRRVLFVKASAIWNILEAYISPISSSVSFCRSPHRFPRLVLNLVGLEMGKWSGQEEEIIE